MRIQFIGGVRTVTGSCTRLTVNDLEILVDCGLHQGRDMDERNRTAFLFDPRQIDILFLTHAHIDHSGLIPRLVRDGFRGKILTTSATADLVEIMLYDSAEIQEKDAEWLTKKSFRSGRDIVYEPLYRTEDVRAALPLIDRQAYDSINHLGNGVKYRFVDAGHILGSGSLEIWYQDSPVPRRIVFSGDIGKSGNPIINDPQQVEEADYVVMESTYGNREHKNKEKSIDELVDAITTTFKRGGNVLIPAFAVGRTQDLLYVLNNLVREGRLQRCDVYVDSPLAEEATKIYLAHPECYDEEARRLFRERKTEALRLHFTGSVEESQKINRIRSGAIIIAGSGMCDGGRIRHHLKHNLWRKECSIVFVGFQAKGSLGREIIDGDRLVRIFGEEVAVNASVYTIGGFSAHADRRELLGWLRAFRNKPEVFVVHGEDEVSLGFAETVRETFDLTVHVPEKGDLFEI